MWEQPPSAVRRPKGDFFARTAHECCCHYCSIGHCRIGENTAAHAAGQPKAAVSTKFFNPQMLGLARFQCYSRATSHVLVEPLLPSKVAERNDVCEAEGEAVEILIAHIGDCVAPVFQGNAAAVPIVGRLACCKLELAGLRVEAETARGAEPAARQSAIAKGNTKLLELAGDLGGYGRWAALAFTQSCGGGIGLRNLQERIAATESKWPGVVVQQQSARINSAQLKIVIHVPLGVGVTASCDSEPRHYRRQMAWLCEKCDAGQVLGRG